LNISERSVRTYRAKLTMRIGKRVAKITSQANTGHGIVSNRRANPIARPPFNAEYVLHLLLRKEEREVVIGDLVECYGEILGRFGKRHADIWFYKQVTGSLLPLFRRALLRIGALVWLGRILRRLIS